MNEQRRDLIRQIHASGRQGVICVTGGAASVIGDLLRVPGASRSILEARVPYASRALNDWLKHQPDAYCARDTALSMATMAWSRAQQLADPDTDPTTLIGISCTASLASDRPKHGDHRCFIATQTASTTRCFSLKLHKGARDRLGEEELVSTIVLQALSEGCGLNARCSLEFRDDEWLDIESETAPTAIQDVWLGRAPFVWSLPNGELTTQLPTAPRGILSGAFHPLHHGHEQLAQVAERRLGGSVAFEMTIMNADKPRLDYLSIDARRQQFQRRPVALTAARLFVDKARLFPNTTFVVGFDTASRLLDPRFHDHSEQRLAQSFDELRSLGGRFLVAGRQVNDQFETLSDLHVPAAIADLFDGLTEAEFRDDISSTELRRASHLEVFQVI